MPDERCCVVGTDPARGRNAGEATVVVADLPDLPDLGPGQVLVTSYGGQPGRRRSRRRS